MVPKSKMLIGLFILFIISPQQVTRWPSTTSKTGLIKSGQRKTSPYIWCRTTCTFPPHKQSARKKLNPLQRWMAWAFYKWSTKVSIQCLAADNCIFCSTRSDADVRNLFLEIISNLCSRVEDVPEPTSLLDSNIKISRSLTESSAAISSAYGVKQ